MIVMKTCLVLEGGGLRGIYTAGVLDALEKDSIKIDAIIGVSMGSLVGINYVSNQPNRTLRYNLKYCKDKRYISFLSLLKTGNIVNKDFAFYEIPNRLDPFDYRKFDASKIRFFCTVTNVLTGKAEYIEIKHSKKEIEYFRAGAAMPWVSRIVEIKGKKYLDGGMSDSIPVLKAIELGYDRIIVVLTRPIYYRKKEKSLNLLSSFYYRYPKFVELIRHRNQNYNATLELISELEKTRKIFVIRPSKTIPIKRIEHNPERIQAQYDLGVEDYDFYRNDLLKYLQK